MLKEEFVDAEVKVMVLDESSKEGS